MVRPRLDCPRRPSPRESWYQIAGYTQLHLAHPATNQSEQHRECEVWKEFLGGLLTAEQKNCPTPFWRNLLATSGLRRLPACHKDESGSRGRVPRFQQMYLGLIR